MIRILCLLTAASAVASAYPEQCRLYSRGIKNDAQQAQQKQIKRELKQAENDYKAAMKHYKRAAKQQQRLLKAVKL